MLLIVVIIAMTVPLISQGTHALDNVVLPCDSGLILKIDYRGFGMISTPEGERVYLQVCQDGKLAYQTARGRVRMGVLDASKMILLKAELQSPDLERVDAHYTAPRGIDASISLYLIIQRNLQAQFVKMDNVAIAWPPAPLDRLLTLVDTFREDAGFTIAGFRPQ
jgi:hypothetical protein